MNARGKNEVKDKGVERGFRAILMCDGLLTRLSIEKARIKEERKAKGVPSQNKALFDSGLNCPTMKVIQSL